MSARDDASAEIATEMASIIQAGHIRSNPDPDMDMAPGTAADDQRVLDANEKHDDYNYYYSDYSVRGSHHADAESIDIDEDEQGGRNRREREDEEDIPYSVLRPPPSAGRERRRRRRRPTLPPLPDLRFEQSYLKSIASADNWWKIALITTRDQVIMPLIQGLVYNLLLCGWQRWNRNAKIQGNSVGARVRRWWYGVNNWTIPGSGQHQQYRR